jgi:hypothetical protein
MLSTHSEGPPLVLGLIITVADDFVAPLLVLFFFD